MNSKLLILLALAGSFTFACTDGSKDGDTDVSDTDTNDTVDTNDTDTVDTNDTDTTDTDVVDTYPDTDPCTISGITCDGNNISLTGTITDSFTMTPDKNWILKGGVFIGDDVHETILAIRPGTSVFGDGATDGFLVIQRSSKLIADGTKDAPILFTSAQLDGSRGPSDWGGLVINGRAPSNSCASPSECNIPGEAATGTYGGQDTHDSSGILRYVRVEFAGTLINTTNELNGIAFQGVGDGTVVDYVQTHQTADDGIEFFGGTVNAKHLVITGAQDDGFDYTDGFSGKVQYVVVQAYNTAADRGIEGDNNKNNNEATPRSNPTLQNFTLIAAQNGGTPLSTAGLLLREGTSGQFNKFAVQGYGASCLDLDKASTFTNAWDAGASALNGSLAVSNSYFYCPAISGAPFPADADDGSQFTVDDFVRTLNDGNVVGTDPKITAAYNETAPNYKPASGSPLLNKPGNDLSDPFIDATSFIGAMGADDWTAGWTTHATN